MTGFLYPIRKDVSVYNATEFENLRIPYRFVAQ